MKDKNIGDLVKSEFKFYNKGLFFNLEIYKTPNQKLINSNEIWSRSIWGKVPLFLCYTTDYDTDMNTDWWYTILDHHVDIKQLSSKQRYKIKNALKYCYCSLINSTEYNRQMINIANIASSNYKRNTKIQYNFKGIKGDVIGCFLNNTNELIGFCVVEQIGDMLSKVSEKCLIFTNKNVQPSTVLSWYIIENYLNNDRCKMISNGSRTVNHLTHHNDFLIEKFNYRRAYCKLNIKLNPTYSFFIKLAYCFRFFTKIFDFIPKIHSLNAFFAMYKISKEMTNDKRTV